MTAFSVITALALSLLVAPFATPAQPAGKLPRIGVLEPGSPPGEPGTGGQRFRQGLRELGDLEGQTITLEVRWAENQPERYPDLAADLVRLPVDIIVAGDPAAAVAAQHATRTIPIVAISFDPVRDGLVTSLARPGGNITGAGCEFSRVPTLLTLAIVEAKSGSRVWCRQKNAWHAGAAWRMAGA